jgi:hypothetical protein
MVGHRRRPSGDDLPLAIWFVPPHAAPLADEHQLLSWPPYWRQFYLGALCSIVLVSIPAISPQGGLTIQGRWVNRFHQFTWGAGLKAMKEQSGAAPAAQPGAAQPQADTGAN